MAAHPESALCRLAEEAGGVDGPDAPFWRQRPGDETALAVAAPMWRSWRRARPVSSTSSGRRRWPSAEVWPGAPEHLLLEPCAAGSGRCASPATAGGHPHPPGGAGQRRRRHRCGPAGPGNLKYEEVQKWTGGSHLTSRRRIICRTCGSRRRSPWTGTPPSASGGRPGAWLFRSGESSWCCCWTWPPAAAPVPW